MCHKNVTECHKNVYKRALNAQACLLLSLSSVFSPSSCSVFACVFLSLSSVFSPSSCTVCRYCRDWLLGRLGLRFVGQVGDARQAMDETCMKVRLVHTRGLVRHACACFALLCRCLLWSSVAEFWICYCWNLTSSRTEMTKFWEETRILATFGSFVYDIFGAFRNKTQNVPLALERRGVRTARALLSEAWAFDFLCI